MAVTRGASKRQRIEPKHALEVLPGSAWRIIGKHVADFDRVAFGFTCKTFLEAVTMATANPDLKKKVALKTDLRGHRLFEEMPRFSLNWFQWVFQSFERRKGAPGLWHGPGWYYDHFYDSHLMYLAAFQGSKKAMEWLVSQGIPLKIKGKYFRSVNNEVVAVLGAAAGGHIAMLEWLRSKGCEFDESTCSGAAKGGHLDVLKWLRSQDPPCDWDQETCRKAARRGHLDVLQWARSQDPPCDWNWRTCKWAARGGHLDVLKWLRSQDPPCPWDAWTCLGQLEEVTLMFCSGLEARTRLVIGAR
ncbi:hypothetical protein A3770_13p69940 [Chloropicon primus]|uniref:Ankyrin repeat domain-containing protein n=1 Tax=Chloropicon primus TaxID=1764295 RepID=A0A5B8MWC3_9CHLO|nr:hypothetical protein A3770_13p69940 [Chloropicon primus]|eukprot:QDZ24476.1 hypothetical protein A3770_13p69940 [Chloropicon primus]